MNDDRSTIGKLESQARLLRRTTGPQAADAAGRPGFGLPERVDVVEGWISGAVPHQAA